MATWNHSYEPAAYVSQLLMHALISLLMLAEPEHVRALSNCLKCSQATGGRPVPGSTQYSPRGVPQAEKEAVLASASMARFLERACYK